MEPDGVQSPEGPAIPAMEILDLSRGWRSGRRKGGPGRKLLCLAAAARHEHRVIASAAAGHR